MLDRTDFASWQQRIRLYCRGKENGVNILKSIHEGPFQMGTFREILAEGNEGALHLGPERARVYSDLSPEDKDRYNADIRATNILLQGLPKDIYTLINHYTYAKDILDNVKMLLEGSELTKEDRESQLYDDFEHFCQNKGETIHDYYVRNQATVQDGRIVVQNVQGRQNRGQGNNARGTGVAGNEGVQNRVGNANPGQARQIKCYNCNGGQDNVVDKDVDEPPVQDLALNVDNVFQADECDAFDSDVDEAPTAQTMFMANLSSADPVYDEVGPSYDSDILSEYVKDNAEPVVQNNVSSVPNDAYMMIINEMHEQTAQCVSVKAQNKVVEASLTAELATYKEQVELYERRAKFELTEREQKIKEQLRIVITDRNIKEENLKKELHSVKMQLNSTINHNKSMVEEVTSLKKDFKQKENKYLEEFLDMKALKEKVAIGYKNPFYLTRAKQVQPALYNGHEIIKTHHVPTIVHNSEDTLEIAEITRKKMNDKMKTPLWTEHNINIRPPDYSKENYLATFTPQTQLTPKQIFWSKDVLKIKAKALKEQTKASKPITVLTVYPPNTPATLIPRVLPTKIQITRAKHIEQTTALLTENENLKVKINEKMKCVTMDFVKPKVLAPGVNSCTDASGSKPRSNTKKNRISPAKSVNKKKVEEHPGQINLVGKNRIVLILVLALSVLSPAAIATSSMHATRALVPSRADILLHRKRFRDSISLMDSVEEDIDTDVLEDIEADATTIEVAVDRDVVAGVDAGIDMEVDVEDEVESNDRGTMEVGVDVVVGIDIPDGMLIPDAVEHLEQVEEGLQDIYDHVMAALVISISSDVSVESVGSSFPRVILIGSISVEVSVAPVVGAAAVASPAGVLELDTHSSLEADPSESSPPPVSIAPMVSPFLCSDDSESDTEMPKSHVSPIPHDAMLTRFRYYDRMRFRRLETFVVRHLVEEALAAYEATRAANALEAESQSQNGSDGNNGNGGDGNGGNGNPNENNRGSRPVARECTYQDFIKCQPLNFKGTEGVVRLIRWFEKMETVFHISNCPEKYQVKYATCTLLNSALTWWNSHKRTIGADAAFAMS
ncbi:hypothetical protein Tco_0748125 [Tanacetum coccineum]|uniref:Reverse transcriptase domain-containing protein n=1 Tax=Tanacetum coccineum TaxID=301880 RepID=A0ABQ4YUT7_9ASTR